MRTKEQILTDIENLQQELKKLEDFEKYEAHLYPFYDKSLHEKVKQLQDKIEEYNIPLRVTVNENSWTIVIDFENNPNKNNLVFKIKDESYLESIKNIIDEYIVYCDVYHQLRKMFNMRTLQSLDITLLGKNHFNFECASSRFENYQFDIVLNDDLSVKTVKGYFIDKVDNVNITHNTYKTYGYNLNIKAIESPKNNEKIQLTFSATRRNFPLHELTNKIKEIINILNDVPDDHQ